MYKCKNISMRKKNVWKISDLKTSTTDYYGITKNCINIRSVKITCSNYNVR